MSVEPLQHPSTTVIILAIGKPCRFPTSSTGRTGSAEKLKIRHGVRKFLGSGLNTVYAFKGRYQVAGGQRFPLGLPDSHYFQNVKEGKTIMPNTVDYACATAAITGIRDVQCRACRNSCSRGAARVGDTAWSEISSLMRLIKRTPAVAVHRTHLIQSLLEAGETLKEACNAGLQSSAPAESQGFEVERLWQDFRTAVRAFAHV